MILPAFMVAWAYIHCPQSWMVLLICMWCHCISSTCGASPFLHILLTPFKDLVFIYWLTFPSWPGDASKLSWSLYFHSSTAFFSWLLAHRSCVLAWFDDGWTLLVALGSPVLPVGSPVLPAPPSHPQLRTLTFTLTIHFYPEFTSQFTSKFYHRIVCGEEGRREER